MGGCVVGILSAGAGVVVGAVAGSGSDAGQRPALPAGAAMATAGGPPARSAGLEAAPSASSRRQRPFRHRLLNAFENILYGSCGLGSLIPACPFAKHRQNLVDHKTRLGSWLTAPVTPAQQINAPADRCNVDAR